MAKRDRKECAGRVASGKYCRCNENYSSCQYPPNPARCPARLELLVTYMDSCFGISRARAKPAEPPHSFSSPGSGGRGPPKTGIGDRRQDQSFKILLDRAGSGVCLAILARTNSEGSMKPAIMLVDVTSTNREGLKSFLQNENCDVDTAADGESAVRCCLQMQPDLVLLYDSLPDIGSFE